MTRNLMTTMMCSVLLTACTGPMGHSFEKIMTGGSSPKESHSTYQSHESSRGTYQFPESSQGYHGSLGKIEGGKIYDNYGNYKGSVNSSGNVYDQHKRPVYHEGPSPFSFDDAVDHVIKHGN